MKKFNTTAVCIPSEHYMVDLSERVKAIKQYVDDGKFFTISRARQYGKTTTLHALQDAICEEYIVLSLDFQDIGDAVFRSEGAFVQGMSRIICDAADFFDLPLPDKHREAFEKLNEKEEDAVKMDELFRVFMKWFMDSEKRVVLLIDEVDSATNNQVFLDFLAQLRSQYIKRAQSLARGTSFRTFQSVILAGVTDVRYLKTRIRPEDEKKENSPWNIAATFDLDMSFSVEDIRGMLEEYEEDHHTGMDIEAISGTIRDYTNGYPFLVSRICQLLDEEVSKMMPLAVVWTGRGMDEAIKMILAEDNPLFQSLTKNLNNFPEMKAAIRRVLMEGEKLVWSPDQKEIVQLQMYGLIRKENNSVRIANRIFETRLYNLFLSDEELKNNVFTQEGGLAKNLFVTDGKLNMRLIMERFIVTYTQVFGALTERFKEKDGRELFLLYIKPIINGTGNYYIEAQTRNQTRTDVIIDYLGQQYIIELKIWRGERYNADGEKQISEYLDYWKLDTGYMLSFNFNKKKEQGVKLVQVGDKVLYEGTV